jgi:hypothetical protein
MKRFMVLLKWEYNGIFLPLCVIAGAMAALQTVLFLWQMRGASYHVPLSYLIINANIPIVFAVAFTSTLAFSGVNLFMNFTPSKSMYALLTLPGKRKRVYQAKLTAGMLAGAVLVAAQMSLVLLFAWMMGPGVLRTLTGGMDVPRNADLYLALLEVPFLRMLFPPGIFARVVALVGIGGSVCVASYISAAVKAGRRRAPIITAVIWPGLLLFAFPLAEASRRMNIIVLALMAIIVYAVYRMGIKLFETGEVTG